MAAYIHYVPTAAIPITEFDSVARILAILGDRPALIAPLRALLENIVGGSISTQAVASPQEFSISTPVQSPRTASQSAELLQTIPAFPTWAATLPVDPQPPARPVVAAATPVSFKALPASEEAHTVDAQQPARSGNEAATHVTDLALPASEEASTVDTHQPARPVF